MTGVCFQNWRRLLSYSTIMFVLGFLMFCWAGVASAQTVTVRVNGQVISFDQPPVIVEGRTLVPVRAIFEALGANVTWQGETNTVLATRGQVKISLQVGNKNALKNMEKITLDVPPMIIKNRVLVPLRFVSESLGAHVSWDGEQNTIRISTSAETPPKGDPIAEGQYDPSAGLNLKYKLNPKMEVEVILEPGALAKAATVKLYIDSSQSYRLVTGSDVITQSLPGKTGFDGARIKVIFIQQWPFDIKRPVMLANGEQINSRCWISEKVIRSGVQVVERDTSLKVVEATNAQWERVQILY